MNPGSPRYYELDSLRGIAAMSVFFSHAIGMLNPSELLTSLSNSIVHVIWDGAAAVDFFFVLSGFCLALPYVGGSNCHLEIPDFVVRRVFRIYPAYFVSLALALFLKSEVFQAHGLEGLSAWINTFWHSDIGLRDFLNHALLIGPSFNTHQINPVIWTLATEMRMALIFPVVILVVRKLTRFRDALLVLGVAYLLALMTVLIEHAVLGPFPSFVIGAVLAHFKDDVALLFARRKRVLALLLIPAVIFYDIRYSIPGLGLNNFHASLIASVGSAMIIAFVIASRGAQKTLQKGPVVALGKVSYSFYLVHLPILIAISSVIYGETRSIVLSWFVSLLITLIAAFGLYYAVERPAQKFGRLFGNKWRERDKSLVRQ